MMKISMRLIYQYIATDEDDLKWVAPTSNHLHPLQVENCNSNSQLVVGEMTMVNSDLKGLNPENFHQSGKSLLLIRSVVLVKSTH